MSAICSGAPVAPRPQELGPPVNMAEAPVATLREIVRQHGTPTYAYDLQRIRTQVDRLRESLPRQLELFYSLKANPSLGLCGFLADCGLGATGAPLQIADMNALLDYGVWTAAPLGRDGPVLTSTPGNPSALSAFLSASSLYWPLSFRQNLNSRALKFI